MCHQQCGLPTALSLCQQQLVLPNFFIRRRQHRLRTPSARVTTSLLIADYSLLNQLVHTGSWHMSTETPDVLRSSDA